jgi:hypothetical protein
MFSRARNGLGKEYGLFTIGSGVGWMLGSLLSGLLYVIGESLVYITSALIVSLPFVAFYVLYPEGREGNEGSKVESQRCLKFLS